MGWFGIVSFGAAATVFLAVTALILVGRPNGRVAWGLVAAGVVTIVWAGTLAAQLLADRLTAAMLFRFDAVHCLAWIGAALMFLGPGGDAKRGLAARLLTVAAAALAVWILIVAGRVTDDTVRNWIFLPQLGLALAGLLAVEQILRNSTEVQRGALRAMCLGLGGIFVADLFVYSQAALLNGLSLAFWESRGLANAAMAPFLVLAIRRHPSLKAELFVSRQVAFYSATLLGMGTYLLAMSGAAYLIQILGGEWSLWIQVPFLIAAIAMLLFLMFATAIKARIKVLLVKHFYQNKYDYRVEWLRLTERLGQMEDWPSLASHALEGLMAIIGAGSGAIWLKRDEPEFQQAVARGESGAWPASFAADHPMIEFLDRRRWVIDSDEYASEPERYHSAFGPPEEAALPTGAVILPLDCQGRLLGFAVLEKPPDAPALNFEDHDILKTAGRQIAVVLAHLMGQEKLAETRQFDAMNKLSAFLMHDLKNVVAQQELVVANARKFGQRPEFIDDAIRTVQSGAVRMRRVLDQLQSARSGVSARHRVDVEKLLRDVQASCAASAPVPALEIASPPPWISADRDKLASVLTHLVRNAQDATPEDGRVIVSAALAGDTLELSVADTGSGMTPEFMRERLFKPFDSTKGVQGMGIGAYQARETVRAMGGDLDVSSRAGEGSTFRIRLPRR